MNQWITITEYNWVLWVAGLFALFEFFRWAYGGIEWVFNKFGIETKKMREKRKMQKRLENAEKAITEIKETSKTNVEMFLDHERQVVEKFTGIKDEIVEELAKIHEKIDAQKETDRAILRDRIAGGMRYFSQSKDEEGKVHVSFSDYENMEELFKQYFAKGGNGAFKKMYDTEFQKFIIDR